MVCALVLGLIKITILRLTFFLSVPVVVSPEKLPILACHVPLDAELIDVPQGLEACSHIILSTSNPLFLLRHELYSSTEWEKEMFALEFVRYRIPAAHFIFSLRTGSVKNLSDLFDGPSSLSSLISFFKSYDLKSFDVAWELIQSTTDFARLLKGLGTTLAKAGFGITSTLGDASRATSSTDFSGIFPFIDLLFLVPNGNPIYSPQLNLLQPGNELTFDYLEVNEGSVLEHLPLLNTDREKIVIGLSLQALIWKVNSEAVDLPHFPRSTVGQLEIQPYVEVCNMSDNEWSPLPQQTNPFYTLAKQSSTGKWMILVDPASLSNRIKLLMKNGFRGVGLYDYDMDDHEGRCGEVKSPLMVEASVSVGSDDLNPLEDPLSNSEMCVPFLGLNAGCSKVARNEWEPAETTATGTSSSDGETSPSENYLTSSGYTSRGSSYNQATLIQTIRTRRSADETHVSSTEMSSFAPVTEAMVSLEIDDNLKATPTFGNDSDEFMEGSSPTSTVQSTHEFKPNGLHLPNENLIEIFEQKTEGSGEFYENFQLQSTLLPEEITSSSLFTFSSPNLHEAESSNSFNFTEETTFHHTGHKLFASSSSDQSVFLSESNETDAPGASTTNVVEALEETTVNEYFSSESDKESNVKVSTFLYTTLDSSSESSLSTTEREPGLTPESSTSEENEALSTTEATEGVTATDQPTSTLQLHETESSEIGSFISSSYPPEPIEPETSAFTTSSVPAEHQSSISSSSSDELSNYFTTTDATDDSSVSALLSTAHSFDDISNGGLIGSSATSYSHPELSSNSPSTVKESVYISFSTLAPPIDSSTEISSLTSSTEGFDDLLSSTVHKESPISKHDVTDSWESTVQPYFESTTSSAMSTDEISSETGNQGSVTNLASTEDHSVHSLTTEESANGYTRYHTGPLNVNIKEEPTSTTGYSFHHGNGEFTDYETYASSDVSFSSEISSVTPARPSFGSEASSLFPFSSGTTGPVIEWNLSSSDSSTRQYEISPVITAETWTSHLVHSQETSDSLPTVTTTDIALEQEEVLHDEVTTSSSPGSSSPLWSAGTGAPPIGTTIEDNTSLPAFSINGKLPSTSAPQHCTGSSDCSNANAAGRHSVSLSAGDISNSVIIQVNVNAQPYAEDSYASNETRWFDGVVHHIGKTDKDPERESSASSDPCSFARDFFLLKLLLCPKALVSALKDVIKEVVPDIVADLTQSLKNPSNTDLAHNNTSTSQISNDTDKTSDIYEPTTQSNSENPLINISSISLENMSSSLPNTDPDDFPLNYNNTPYIMEDITVDERINYTFNGNSSVSNPPQILYEIGNYSEEVKNETFFSTTSLQLVSQAWQLLSSLGQNYTPYSTPFIAGNATIHEKVNYTSNGSSSISNPHQILYEIGNFSEEANNATLFPTTSLQLVPEDLNVANQTEPGNADDEMLSSLDQSPTPLNSTKATPKTAIPIGTATESQLTSATSFWYSGPGRKLQRKAGLAGMSLPLIGRKWRTITPIESANSQLYRLAMSPSVYKKKVSLV